MRLVLAFVLAPLASLFVAIPIAAMRMGSFDAAGPLAVICVGYGYPALLILGFPLYVFFRQRNWLRWWHFIGAGAFVGLITPAIVIGYLVILSVRYGAALNSEPSVVSDLLGLTAVGVGLGAVSGAAFWLLAYSSPSAQTKVLR